MALVQNAVASTDDEQGIGCMQTCVWAARAKEVDDLGCAALEHLH